MKRIMYMAEDNGVDGRAPTSIVFAAFDEGERDRMVANAKSGAWYTKTERIVDVEQETKAALAKLDGVERLLLGLPQRLDPGEGGR